MFYDFYKSRSLEFVHKKQYLIFIFIFFSRNNDSIFDELSCQDADIIGDVDYGADITGKIHMFTVGCCRLTRCFVYDLYLQVF